jgi:SET domain-containing protein
MYNFIIFIFICLLYISYNNESNHQFYIDKSNIHGVGVYTAKKYNKNNYVINIIKKGYIYNISTFGQKINHSYDPNCYLYKDINNNYDLYALRYIQPNEEITSDYSKNPWFFKKTEKHFI